MVFFAGIAVGGVVVGVVTYLIMHDMYMFAVALSTEKMHRAYRECGKLSKKIHKQRLVIKELKVTQVPRPKKTYVPQPTVSH